MDINELFTGKYLRAVDLKGSEPTLVISHVNIEEFTNRGKQEQKAIIYFRGKEKGLGLNKTNANTLTMMFGSETDDWVGQAITIFTIMTEFEGKATPAIRIKAPKRAASPKQAPQQQQQTAESLDDEVPF